MMFDDFEVYDPYDQEYLDEMFYDELYGEDYEGYGPSGVGYDDLGEGREYDDYYDETPLGIEMDCVSVEE